MFFWLSYNNTFRQNFKLHARIKTTRSALTIFSSNCVRGLCLAMSWAVSVSADRTFIRASQHFVRWRGVWWAITHLVVTVKAAGLALWLRFMGLDWIKQGRRTRRDVLKLTLIFFTQFISVLAFLENTLDEAGFIEEVLETDYNENRIDSLENKLQLSVGGV